MSTRLSNLIKRWLQSRRHDLSVHYQQNLVSKVLEEIQLESGASPRGERKGPAMTTLPNRHQIAILRVAHGLQSYLQKHVACHISSGPNSEDFIGMDLQCHSIPVGYELLCMNVVHCFESAVLLFCSDIRSTNAT